MRSTTHEDEVAGEAEEEPGDAPAAGREDEADPLADDRVRRLIRVRDVAADAVVVDVVDAEEGDEGRDEEEREEEEVAVEAQVPRVEPIEKDEESAEDFDES